MVKQKVNTQRLIRLYRRGLSAREVAERFHIGLHTVYRRLEQSHEARRSRIESRKCAFEHKALSFQPSRVLTSKQKKLWLAGIMLYWAEGAKRGTTVDFANSDIAMTKIFIRFLREIYHVDEKRLRGFIYCHEHQDSAKLIQFWARTLALPRRQFTRPYVRMNPNRSAVHRRPDRMPHGLVHVRYADLKLLEHIKREIVAVQNLWVGSEVVKRTTL